MFNDQSESKIRFLLHQSETGTLAHSPPRHYPFRATEIHWEGFDYIKCFTNANVSIISWILQKRLTQGHIILQRQEMHTNRNKDPGWEKGTSQRTGRREIIWGGRTYMGIKILPRYMKDIGSAKLWPITCRLKLIIIIGQLQNSQKKEVYALPLSNTHIHIKYSLQDHLQQTCNDFAGNVKCTVVNIVMFLFAHKCPKGWEGVKD